MHTIEEVPKEQPEDGAAGTLDGTSNPDAEKDIVTE